MAKMSLLEKELRASRPASKPAEKAAHKASLSGAVSATPAALTVGALKLVALHLKLVALHHDRRRPGLGGEEARAACCVRMCQTPSLVILALQLF